MADIINIPNQELLRLKTFRRPWVMWLYCKIWLPFKFKIAGENTESPPTPAKE